MFDFLKFKDIFDFEDYVYYDIIDSTNLKGMELLKTGKKNFLIFAKRQTKGYGRFNRRWESMEGGLYFTFTVDPLKLNYPSHLFSVSASMGIYGYLKKNFSFNVDFRWPNDLLVEGKKISGILLENYEKIILAGIGINVNNNQFSDTIKNIGTSIFILTGKKLKLEDVLLEILNEIFSVKDLRKIIKFLNESGMIGKKVEISTLDKNFTGMVEGFLDDGSILIKNEDGVKNFLAGDVRFLR